MARDAFVVKQIVGVCPDLRVNKVAHHSNVWTER